MKLWMIYKGFKLIKIIYILGLKIKWKIISIGFELEYE